MIGKNKKELDLTKGNILGPLIRFTIPIMGAMVLQSLYGAVDLYIVGKYASTADVSAVANGTGIINMVNQIVVGLSMGCTVLVGRSIGANEKEEAGKVIGSSIILFTITAAFFTVILPVFSSGICTLMNSPGDAFGRMKSYIVICGLGMLFVVAYNLLGSIFRGIGDSKTPLIAVAIACVMNIFGDIYFVRNLGMGTSGAAIATVLAQAVSVIICFFIIRKRGLPFTFNKASFKDPKTKIKNIIRLGIPLALQSFVVSASFSVIGSVVNKSGVVVSAAIGVANKLSSFIMLIPHSFANALAAFVAQNLGARKPERGDKGLKYSIAISLSVGIVIFLFCLLRGDLLTSIFSKDEAVIAAGWDYMKAYAIDVLFTSFMFCFNGYFNGYGRTGFVMMHCILSATLIRVPISIIMAQKTPVSLFMIGLATPTATFFQVIACLVYFSYCKKKEKGRVKNE